MTEEWTPTRGWISNHLVIKNGKWALTQCGLRVRLDLTPWAYDKERPECKKCQKKARKLT